MFYVLDRGALERQNDGMTTITTAAPPTRRSAIFLALFVTFLWSTSWVLIKFGLAQIPALTFAGLRYGLAFLCLLPFLFREENRQALRSLRRVDWVRLASLGVLYYAVTQGSQFLGLYYLPAITVSLMLNFTSVLVAWLGVIFLSESPSRLQWGGLAFFLAGIAVFFYPISFPAQQWLGIAIIAAGVLANAISALLGRSLNRSRSIPPLVVTAVSMGIGAALLLGSGIAVQGFPSFDLASWVIILWLAVVNTAWAFVLWNRTLITLTAMESSIINSTMLIQIALLAALFLGESITWQKGVGMLLCALGALIVQLRSRPGSQTESNSRK